MNSNMRSLISPLIMVLCAIVMVAWVAIDDSPPQAHVNDSPLQTYVNGMGDEFRFVVVGGSWACNAQYAGEVAGSLTGDDIGASGPYSDTLILGDKTAMNGESWINRLGDRLVAFSLWMRGVRE